MFEKETKFHTAFVPVVKFKGLKQSSQNTFFTLKCLMKNVLR